MHSYPFRTLSSVLVATLLATLSSPSLSHAGQYRYRIIDLRALGMPYVQGLNNFGHLVGNAEDGRSLFFDGTKIMDLGNGPYTSLDVWKINDADEIIARVYDASRPGDEGAYVWSKGLLTEITGFQFNPDTLDQINWVWGINNAGQIVGSTNAPLNTHGFVYSKGTITLLEDRLGATSGLGSSTAADINESGVVAGTADDTHVSRAVVWEAGKLRDLGTLDPTNPDSMSWANAINDAGVVVGEADNSQYKRAFVYSAGQMIGLDFLLPDSPLVQHWPGVAHAINNYNVVVGDSDRAFVWYGGRIFNLVDITDCSGTGYTFFEAPRAINDRGQILTYGHGTEAGPVLLTPIPTDGTPGHLVNISVRASTGSSEHTCIAGFVISGGPGHVLVRAAGPALAPLGVAHPVSNPRLSLFSTSSTLASNDDWGSATQSPDLVAAVRQAGAFNFPDGSSDAAIVTTLPAGAYTAHANAVGADGVVLAEVYDANPNGVGSGRITNLSGRVYVGTGEQIGIAGFVIAGDGPCKVILRAVGPGLQPYGIAGFLADPLLRLYTAEGKAVLGNDNWGTAAGYPLLAQNTVKAGAFPLVDGSKDSALMVQLEPGAYTVQISGADGGTGVALLELYSLPDDI